jgi:hypothetical protein
MIELKSKLETINSLFARGYEIEEQLQHIEELKKQPSSQICLLDKLNDQIKINEHLNEALLTVVEYRLEKEIESIYKALKKLN